ncbi:MAG: glucose-6-phosphate isomerase, partial [Congregibacter sp.]
MASEDSGRAAWDALRGEHERLGDVTILELFEDDGERAGDFSLEAAGLYLDYSKNHVSRAGLQQLLELAEQCGLTARISGLFNGERINRTENRAVLHTALRDRSG